MSSLTKDYKNELDNLFNYNPSAATHCIKCKN